MRKAIKAVSSDTADENLLPLLARYQRAANARAPWVTLWQDCYDYTLPAFAALSGGIRPDRRAEKLFDGTAADAVDQLAATLLNNLVPVQGSWFTLRTGSDVEAADAAALAPQLAKYEGVIRQHFIRSNLNVALHQCLLDLIIGGTACLLCEETPPGSLSAYRFAAIPLRDAVLSDSGTGTLDTLYRPLRLSLNTARIRYPHIAFPEGEGDTTLDLLEAVEPRETGGVTVSLVLLEGDGYGPRLLQSRVLGQSPLIAMRWMKAPSEDYGRSPVMKALPDIKTANKVVELILKNASIAVAGIWQADDDGVLNPANITLTPGAIIPKAVGSKGLTPLDMPGKFDVSQLVLDDLRGRIRHALLVDRLPQALSRTMTATEVVARTAEMAVLLSGVYSRLATELLYPLLMRGIHILERRGVLPALPLGTGLLTVDIASPLVKAAGAGQIQLLQDWLGMVRSLGADAVAQLNAPAILAGIGEVLAIPPSFYTPAPLPDLAEVKALIDTLSTPTGENPDA